MIVQLRLAGLACAVVASGCSKSAPPDPAAIAVTAPTPLTTGAPGEAPDVRVQPQPKPPAADLDPAATHAILKGSAAAKGTLYALGTPLEDQRGEAFDMTSLRGHPVIISMFFSHCQYACPTLIRDIRRIEKALPPAVVEQLRVLIVSFDIARDTPAVMREVADRHSAPLDRWTFARAPNDEGTREIAGALGVKYRLLETGDYNHSSIITLLDKTGVPLARIDGLNQDATAFIAVTKTAAGQ